MATYTDNYNLIKPTYAETADIVPLNNNFEKIDEVMHASQNSLAPAYDQTASYQPGDVVMYELNMYKCTGATSGAWDPSKWTRTTAAETGGGGSVDLDIYGEASGTAEASFSDGAEASLVECEIGIVPTQDHHGYSKPWAGGAGKNKFVMPTLAELKTLNTSGTWNDNEYTNNGITFTCNFGEDGFITTIEESGTATGQAEMWLKTFSGLDGNYYFSGGINNNKYITYQKNGSWSGVYIKDADVAVTFATADTIRPIIAIGSGQTGTSIFMPMIRLSSIADNTFEPYSNICPISGHSSITVTVASTSGGSGEDTTVSLGRTVYGGTLDVTTGELTVDKVGITLNGSEQWNYTAPNVYSYYVGTNIKNFTAIFNEFKSVNKSYTSMVEGDALNYSGYITVYKPSRYNTMADYIQAIGNIQAVYELATPQTFTLTPTQVKTLLGQNYVSHDGGGTISLVYVKGDAPIKPNPTGADIPLKGLEIDGEKFSIRNGAVKTELYSNVTVSNPSVIVLNDDIFNYDMISVRFFRDADSIPENSVYITIDTQLLEIDQTISFIGWAGNNEFVLYKLTSRNTLTLVLNGSRFYIRKITGIRY